MKYLTQFDSLGKRVTSYPLDGSVSNERYAEMLNEGFVEIDEEDWNYYVGNKGGGNNGTGYIRDGVTGKPVSAPPYVPSKSERLAVLDVQYDSDKIVLAKYYTEAGLSGNTALQGELRQELDDLNAEYTAKRKEIEEG